MKVSIFKSKPCPLDILDKAVRLMKDKREVNERREANKELIFKAKVKTSC